MDLRDLSIGDLVIVLNCSAPPTWSNNPPILKWWISEKHIGTVLSVHDIDRSDDVPELILRLPDDAETGRWAAISNIMLVSKKE